MLAAVIALGAAVAVLGVLVAGLLRSHAAVLRALHELGADLDPDSGSGAGGRPAARRASGAAAHDLTGTDPEGRSELVGVAGTLHDTLLVFLSTGCSTCRPFWQALREGASAPAGTQVLVVTRDAGEEDPAQIRALAGPAVAVLMSTAAWRDYAVPGSPHVVHVDGRQGRVIGEGIAGSWSGVLDLFGQAGADSAADSRGRVQWLPGDNAARVDSELARAGIRPGDASLYPDAPEQRP